MARETRLVCDGCGLASPNFGWSQPKGWVSGSVRIRLGTKVDGENARSDDILNKSFDLCQDCYGRFMENADPSSWRKGDVESSSKRFGYVFARDGEWPDGKQKYVYTPVPHEDDN